MVEEPTPSHMAPALHFDPGPLALDLYRLLCMYLADRRVMNLALDSDVVRQLHDNHLGAEVLRVLISSAVHLRIAFDQYPERLLGKLGEASCGILWQRWPKRKSEVLTTREACNKIIHAAKI